MKKDNTPDTPQKNTLENMTMLEVIGQCGKLKYPVDKVVSILYSKDNDMDTCAIRKQIITPGTPEYKAYHSGIDAGDYEVDTAFHDAASSGDADAQKALHEIQRERTVGDAIREKFFPDSDS